METSENYKKPIIIRKIRDNVWQKFRVICKKQGIKSANKGTIKLIEDCVAKWGDNMQTEKIMVLPDAGNPCRYCGKREATDFATIRINEAGSITTQLCEKCTTIDDDIILGRILP